MLLKVSTSNEKKFIKQSVQLTEMKQERCRK